MARFTVNPAGAFKPAAPPRFDSTEVEDPNIVELPNGGGTLLFYTGAWVEGDVALNCSAHDQLQPDSTKLANAQRIGVAYRPKGSATWQRQPEPVLSVRVGKWDSVRVSNPAALVFPNGSVLLGYRGNGHEHGGIGMAIAPHWSGPYTQLYGKSPATHCSAPLSSAWLALASFPCLSPASLGDPLLHAH